MKRNNGLESPKDAFLKKAHLEVLRFPHLVGVTFLGPDPVLGHNLLLAGAGIAAQDTVVILSLPGSGSGHGLLGTETTTERMRRATVASQRGQRTRSLGKWESQSKLEPINRSERGDRGGFLQQHLLTLTHHHVGLDVSLLLVNSN